MTERYCVDCKHCDWFERLRTYVCRRGDAELVTDLVTGVAVRPMVGYCCSERLEGNDCGPEGKFFEAAPTTLKPLMRPYTPEERAAMKAEAAQNTAPAPMLEEE